MTSLAKILDGLSMLKLDIAHTDVSRDENELRKTTEGFGGL